MGSDDELTFGVLGHKVFRRRWNFTLFSSPLAKSALEMREKTVTQTRNKKEEKEEAVSF